jgi:putative transposase
MRQARMLKEGARYHVTARTNNKLMLMRTDKMKELFLEIVIKAKKKYDFSLDHFCIMGNHFHFIIKPGKHESLSRILQ